jgi:hypothetical protein
MAIEITQQPPDLCYVGNLPDIELTTTEDLLEFILTVGGDELLTETFYPDTQGNIIIPIRKLLEDQVSMRIPEVNLFVQQDAVKDVVCLLDEEEVNFRIVKGGVDRKEFVTADFLPINWLTWQPQSKQVKYRDPEYLSYYPQEEVTVKVRVYFQDGTDTEFDVYTLQPGLLQTVNVTFEYIHGLFANQPIYFDVWIASDDGELTWRQRYVLTDQAYEFDDLFVFENSLGGIDTIRFTGQKTLINKQQFDRGLFFDEFELEYDINPDRAYEKNTGFFRSTRQLFWSQDFFSSLQKYLVQGSELRRVLTREPQFEAARFDLIAFDFQFVFTRQVVYLDWVSDAPLDVLVIIGPDEEQYYLVPRLWLFPMLEDPSGAIFPVQLDGEQQWYGVTMQKILEYLLDQIDIPSGDRVIDPGVFEMVSPTSGTLTGAKFVRNGIERNYTGPVTLLGTPEAPNNAGEIIYTQAANTVGYIRGDEAEEPVFPNPPPGEFVLHQILRLNTGEEIITPVSPEYPQTANEISKNGQFAPIWQQTLNIDTYYSFQLAFVSWASAFYNTSGHRPKSGTLHVNFVTAPGSRLVDSLRFTMVAVDIGHEHGDFVLVQTSPTQATLFAKKTAYHGTVVFKFLIKTQTVREDSLVNNGIHGPLPAGTQFPSKNYLAYVPTTGSEIRSDKNRSYGYNGTPVTGDISISVLFAQDAFMPKMLHNGLTPPAILKPDNVVLHKSGGFHVNGVINEYLFIYHKNNAGNVTRISYSISQPNL